MSFQLMDSAIHLTVRNHFREILSQFRNPPNSPSACQECLLSTRDGPVTTDIVLLLAALPQLSQLLCDGCVGSHQNTTFILPDYSQAEVKKALDVLLARGDVSFLHRIMIDGADIEDEDKDSIINSSHKLGELQTTREVFLCKTEDSTSDIEEIGAESFDTECDDNHLLEDDGFCTTPPGKNEPIVSDDNWRDAAGSEQQIDIRKFCKRPKKTKKSAEKKEKVRGPDHCWVEVETFRSDQEFGQQPEAAIVQELRENFTFRHLRRNANNDQASEYICRYTRKKGYRKCPFMYRVLRFHNFPEVIVERIEGVEHHHERLEGHDQPSQFQWTREMTETLCTNIRLGHSARRLSRILELSHGDRPSQQQLNNKISSLRKKFGLGTSSRHAYRSYEEYREWRQLEKLETPQEGIIAEVGGSTASSDNELIVPTSETETNVNVKAGAGIRPPVRARNNWSEVSRFESAADFARSDLAEELKQFSCREKQERGGAASVAAVKIYRFSCSFSRRAGYKPCRSVFSTLIGRAQTRLGSHWSRA